ncbi:unnamed protein product [Medioppia subpectinata]|uniref:Uncharacterized protein n=1 Tax=Medioppia subpectinata TaxID=1979941 RepID=A0A7R9KR22_9ACAR|nr:unnamed protein product [Medioppia subpectinata]CAG2107136.1 unnamed protein product [Medioppia subpectinata]
MISKKSMRFMRFTTQLYQIKTGLQLQCKQINLSQNVRCYVFTATDRPAMHSNQKVEDLGNY